ncbi:MAG: hypothetical protein ABIQ16_25920 [Polyangiaceae bacterium]
MTTILGIVVNAEHDEPKPEKRLVEHQEPIHAPSSPSGNASVSGDGGERTTRDVVLIGSSTLGLPRAIMARKNAPAGDPANDGVVDFAQSADG